MNFRKIFQTFVLLILTVLSSRAQTHTIKGKVTDSNSGETLAFVQVGIKGTANSTFTDSTGHYILQNINYGNNLIQVALWGYETLEKSIEVHKDIHLNFQLVSKVSSISEVVLQKSGDDSFGITRLKSIEGTSINAGKKNEVIVLENLNANTSTNNTRQIYSKIPGLNIWESDGAGIQLGIGGRGLNPNRTSNFNTRQNGYDISADALGYPESYYSPPAEAIEKIEIIRGAGSLQYGPQFGGFINFRLKKGASDTAIEIVSRQTLGSFNFFNSFNSIGGTKKKLNYYTFYQYKKGDGWRPNSHFDVHTAFANVSYGFNNNLSISADYTFMHYLARQPGGLTDQMFYENPRQVARNRNWFRVNWNLFALTADYKLNSRLKFNTRLFGLIAERAAIGVLTAPNRPDLGGPRNLWFDNFRNYGNETRMIYTYHTNKNISALLVGLRYYSGYTFREQGFGNSGDSGLKSDFKLIETNQLDYSVYSFPGKNLAFFIENLFQITPKLSITPGLRYEYIVTKAFGEYNKAYTNLAGTFIHNELNQEQLSRSRGFLIGGIGIEYEINKQIDIYTNITQNYRSINFSDLRSANRNLIVDPNIEDEKGYSADLGIRGAIRQMFNYDINIFSLNYNNRIGTYLPLNTLDRIRTNISRSRTLGVESFMELDFWRLIHGNKSKAKICLFSNISLIEAKYISTKVTAFNNKKVELVPDLILKSGLSYRLGRFSSTFQFSYTSSQYTDATNSILSNGIVGLIPSYYIADFTTQYSYKRYSIAGTVNNLFNRMYFTRRSEGYPGPGIIPSDGRAFYLSLQVKI